MAVERIKKDTPVRDALARLFRGLAVKPERVTVTPAVTDALDRELWWAANGFRDEEIGGYSIEIEGVRVVLDGDARRGDPEGLAVKIGEWWHELVPGEEASLMAAKRARPVRDAVSAAIAEETRRHGVVPSGGALNLMAVQLLRREYAWGSDFRIGDVAYLVIDGVPLEFPDGYREALAAGKAAGLAAVSFGARSYGFGVGAAAAPAPKPKSVRALMEELIGGGLDVALDGGRLMGVTAHLRAIAALISTQEIWAVRPAPAPVKEALLPALPAPAPVKAATIPARALIGPRDWSR